MDQHGIGPKTEFMVANDHAEAFDRNLLQPAP
jgi:hypothetical protein